MNKNYLLQEAIVLLSADIYDRVYEKFGGYTETCKEIIRIAKEFEKKLNWREDDDRDFIKELEKFEKEYLESIGSKEKSLLGRYNELFRLEIEQLKSAVSNAGGEVSFWGTDCPIVLVNFYGSFPHPADVSITSVSIKSGRLLINGKEKESSGCSEWMDDEKEIYVHDIGRGSILDITDNIVRGLYLPTWNKKTGLSSDGSWCRIDEKEHSWEYQKDVNDDGTYMSGNFVVDDNFEIFDLDGIMCEPPRGLIAALVALGYTISL